MSKLADHLRKHLRGEVLDTKPALDHFSTDGSVLKVRPKTVIYPRSVTDLRKVTKFCWQLAERGKSMSITTRGKGTDQSGGAIGDGLVVVMPAHMNKLVDIDRESVAVQPGMIYGDLQRTLTSHGRFIPPYPASMDYSTIGGAVANNASGEKSLKYGCTADYVEELEVVLANGQTIRTSPLSKRELNKKKGQSDFEGEIYRNLDGLLADNADVIEQARPSVSKNSAGYALWDVKRPDGTFDLSRLIVGSQGTLGIVSEVTMRTEKYNPDTHLIAAFFPDIEKAKDAVVALQKLEPSAVEIVDDNLLRMVQRHQPDQLKGIIEGDLPRAVMLIEFDEEKTSVRKRKAKKAQKLIKDLAHEIRVSDDYDEQEDLWKIRRSASTIVWMKDGNKSALPAIDDAVVPLERMADFMTGVGKLFAHHNLEVAIWGHAGDANFHMQPLLNLQDAADRQTLFRLMDDFYKMVIAAGGSTSGEHSDGRMRAPYLEELYGQHIYALFKEVKQIFDPLNILNPGVKIGTDRDTLRKQLRQEYDNGKLYDHMPQAHT